MAGRFKMRRLRGFTLVEMIIVVAIIAIVMSYAVPAYNRFVAQNKVQSFAYALAADLQYARSEAIRRGGGVLVCAASSAQATSCAGASASDWSRNWIVLASGGSVIKVNQAEQGVVASAGTGALSFAASGRATGTSSVMFLNGESTVSATVTIAPYGSIKVGN